MKRIASRENPLFRELALVAGSARERRKRDACLLEGSAVNLGRTG